MMLCTLALVLAASTPAAPEAPEAPADPPIRPKGYMGAMTAFKFRDLTVVYPAGPGENVPRNRRSATSRARFLEVQHGVKTRVLADVEAKPSDLAANLMVLGWSNRLLGSARAARPFRTLPGGGWSVFEDVGGEAGDDLLLFGPSPYSAEHALLFWSRIDPEGDRFMPLPSIGSDWAVVRGFRPIRQGMCVPSAAWPPVRDPRAEADHLSLDATAPRRDSLRTTPHYRIRSGPEVLARDVDAVAKAREEAFAEAAARMGVDPAAPLVIDLTVYKDETVKLERTGVPDPAHMVPGRRELHMVLRLARSRASHEEIHVFARERLGATYSTALYEGLAVGFDGVYRGQDLEVFAAMQLASGRIPSVTDLLDEEKLRRIGDEGGFATAGMFTRWLRDTRPKLFPTIYALEEPSPEAVGAVLGLSAADLDTAFRSWIGEVAGRRASDVAFARNEMDAQERLRQGDFAGVAEALERALEAKPDEPQALFNLASARMRTGEFDRAEAAFRRLVALPLSAGQSRFRIFSHYQMGRIFDIRGRRDDALAQYRRVLELPDEYDAHRLAAERTESPATREQLE